MPWQSLTWQRQLLNTCYKGVTIDKDPSIRNLESAVWNQLASIVAPTPPPQNNKAALPMVSLEDALKELIELEKTSQRV